MSNETTKSLLILFIFILFVTQINCFKRVCYLRVDRSQRIDVNTINDKLCTHIILGFAVVINGTIAPKDSDDLIYYQNVTQLKYNFTDIKVMLSIGGGGYDGSGFHEICLNQTNIDKFVSSVLDLLLTYNFDGLDIDWEFPAWNTPYPEDRDNFNQLLKTLSTQFSRQENRIDDRRPLLLSCAVSAIVNVVDSAYDVPQMDIYLDFVNIMSYDFHIYSKYWPFTGFNSPLFGRRVEKSYFTFLNTNRSVNHWIALGMSKEKIMVGIPTYGHVFQLATTQHTGPDSAVTAQLSDVSYTDVCRLIENNSTQVLFDDESKVPYLVNGDHWVTYDDPKSVAFKAQWILDNELGGAMTFDLNSDDYHYVCDNSSKFVLHSVIYSILS